MRRNRRLSATRSEWEQLRRQLRIMKAESPFAYDVVMKFVWVVGGFALVLLIVLGWSVCGLVAALT